MINEERLVVPSPFTPPSFQVNSFNCPYCNAYAQQYWSIMFRDVGGSLLPLKELSVAYCARCGMYSVWMQGKMIFPPEGSVPPPNSDLRDDIREDYNEAKSILSRSPRGASALLRLCIQKLCQQLGLPGKDLDADIGALVKNGLPATIQKALDLVRVIGNNSVHPGVLDLKDDVRTASRLFELVNHIAFTMISQPKAIENLYDEKVPARQKQAIEKRDTKHSNLR
jgi:hypothetical protein